MIDKATTIRLKTSTKQKLVNLDFAKKNMSFEEIILTLLDQYERGMGNGHSRRM